MKKTRTRHKVKPAKKTAESVTALASGMADDFNNILTTVMGACSLIDKDVPENEALIEYVSLIRTSAEHAAVLSDQLMHFVDTAQEKAGPSLNQVSSCDKVTNDDIDVPEKKSGDDKL